MPGPRRRPVLHAAFFLHALIALAACQSPAPSATPDDDPADAIFRTDAAIIRRHGRIMSWEKQQVEGYHAVLQERPPESLSCKERELLLVQPAIDDLIAHADTDRRKTYDDMARHQLLLIIKGGNPCGFPEINLD
ncbi:MAG TPA: hypothetical protein VM639_06815 [Dongiaceae bacterium]|nr:hypothetical protein [Dongiaceae bacterium]